MKNSKQLSMIISIFLALLLIIGSIIIVNKNQKVSFKKQIVMRNITKAELAKENGKLGRSCWVAIDGIVYQISGFNLWKDGEHQTSDGQAHCGLDLSKVIDKAPHGRSKLEQLDKIGYLK